MPRHRAGRDRQGQGSVAEKNLAVAEENGVLVEENPALAEALSTIELNH